MAVRLSAEFGLVVRRAALADRGVTYEHLLRAMEVDARLDADADLISFGPHFGGEAGSELARRLERLGLVYADDFFELTGDFPDWCGLSGFLEREGPGEGARG